jgi:carboxylesterase
MIDINEKFTVAAPPAEVYAVLSDPQAVVECVQGAGLGETHEDGTIDGTMTVKFSAMRVMFKGRIKLDLEPEIMRGTVHATGKDGQGGTKFAADASFDIAALDGGASSEVTATGAVNLSGKMASVIEGAANAVVRRMTGEFVEALSLRCASGSTTIGPAPTADVATGTPDGAEHAMTPGPKQAVLLLHGFGGSPNTLRAWGEALAAAGLTVSIPRLPGHGTRWKDLNRTSFDDWYAEADKALIALKAQHDQVFVMGISLGGLLALSLAERRGSDVDGVVLLNPLVSAVAGTPGALGFVSKFRRSARVPVRSDIHKPGVTEVGYDRIALKAAYALKTAAAPVVAALGSVTQPVLLITSATDHVVPGTDAAMIADGLRSTNLRKLRYENSYHVLPLDDDAPAVFGESIDFTRDHAVSNAARASAGH